MGIRKGKEKTRCPPRYAYNSVLPVSGSQVTELHERRLYNLISEPLNDEDLTVYHRQTPHPASLAAPPQPMLLLLQLQR